LRGGGAALDKAGGPLVADGDAARAGWRLRLVRWPRRAGRSGRGGGGTRGTETLPGARRHSISGWDATRCADAVAGYRAPTLRMLRRRSAVGDRAAFDDEPVRVRRPSLDRLGLPGVAGLTAGAGVQPDHAGVAGYPRD